MKSIRCKKCGGQLMRGEIKQIEIKCPKCGYIQILNNSPARIMAGKQKKLDKDLKKSLS